MSLTSPDFVPHWARSPRWRSFAEQLTRYYTNRAGLNAWTLTLLRPSDPRVAWATPSQRMIGLNPQFPEASGPFTLDRTPAPTLAALTETNLRAYLAHEAGHVRFSCAKPGETQLGSLWNRIEDERIERKMSARHPDLKEAFDTVGDIHLQLAVNSGALVNSSLLEWCLVWRWGHDHPLFNDRPEDPRWAQVQPLLEAAWDAETSEQVTQAARDILALLNVPEDEPKQDGQVSASGGGSKQREETPGAAQAGSPDQDSALAKTTGDPAPATKPPAGQREAGKTQNETGPKRGTEPDDGADPAPDPQGQPQGHADPEHGDPSDAPEHAPSPDNADSGDANSPDSADSGTPELESPAAPASFQDGFSSGGTLADGGPRLTRRPADVGGQAASHEAFSRVIAELICARDRPGMDLSDRSRGRFSYPRFLAGEDRQFRRRTLPTRQRPVLLSVLADTSGSTSQPWCDQTCILAVRAATLAFSRAGMIAGQAAEVYTFDSLTTAVAGRDLSPRQAFEQVRRHPFVAGGGTRLAPALGLALSRPVQGARHLVVIISDGQLTQRDQLDCQALLAQSGGHTSPRLAFLPLLVNTDLAALERWRQLFPQARAAHDPHALLNIARSLLNSLRQGRWQER